MMSAIVAFLSTSIGRWVAGVGLAVLLLGGAALWIDIRAYNRGYAAAIAKIAAQDKEAVDAVNKAVNRIAECRASGGVWRQATGECQRG